MNGRSDLAQRARAMDLYDAAGALPTQDSCRQEAAQRARATALLEPNVKINLLTTSDGRSTPNQNPNPNATEPEPQPELNPSPSLA